MWDYLKKENKVEIFVAKHDEEMAAGAIVLLHKDKMWYWNAVSNLRLRKLSAPSLLLWLILIIKL
jgi:lipid II:glycine glycyltransferase (peptidoglycan interpeptide bridge formation enzyme)